MSNLVQYHSRVTLIILEQQPNHSVLGFLAANKVLIGRRQVAEAWTSGHVHVRARLRGGAWCQGQDLMLSQMVQTVAILPVWFQTTASLQHLVVLGGPAAQTVVECASPSVSGDHNDRCGDWA